MRAISAGMFVCLIVSVVGCGRAKDYYNPREVYVTMEESGVFLVDIDQARKDPSARLWSWKAADSPEIPSKDRGLFQGYDECKPVMGGSAVLVCSSWGGGVALVRREDKKCLFYAPGKNAHSSELIEGGILAVASSGDDGTLRLYDLGNRYQNQSVPTTEPAWSMKLPWGHGVLWDRRHKVLYVLAGEELLKLSVERSGGPLSGEVLMRYVLPTRGGHDLSPWDDGHLAVTVSEGAYLFDMGTGTFSPLADIGTEKGLKCVSRNVFSAQVMYTKAKLPSPLADCICFVGGQDVSLSSNMIYKARWNVRNEFSYDR